MKYEVTHFAAILVIGTERVLRKIPMLYKAAAVLAVTFSAGTVLGSAWTEQREIPSRVSGFDARLNAFERRQDEREAYVDGKFDALGLRFMGVEGSLLDIKRQGQLMLCRQDNSANYCDLQYGGGP